jgi:hypothetical protein
MFCPQCGSTQPDELRFCKNCGANLAAVRTAVANPESTEEFDISKTWVAQMFMTQNEKDRIKGITPEMKRLREVKAGVITASAGVAVTIFLFVLMGGIIASGRASDAAAEILSRIWVAGLIPIFVGAALIFNGIYISRRSEEKELPAPSGMSDDETTQLSSQGTPGFLPPADTNELIPAGFSVTDETTRHLKQPTKN